MLKNIQKCPKEYGLFVFLNELCMILQWASFSSSEQDRLNAFGALWQKLKFA